MKYLFAAAALFSAAIVNAQQAPAQTQNNVGLLSETFVAKTVTDAAGKKDNKLFPAERVLPGDVLVFKLSYDNKGAGPATRFVINNPMPNGVDFTGVRETWATVSVDGKTFAALNTLKIKKPDGTSRAAIPQDVKAIRWSFAQPIAPGAKGNVMFYAVVK